ncbi:MAG: CPBP family intramembrane metalloprotease [Deltaproteobacteria bacterium]|nr:CPBP family intramembrane metalloprotease [Deltaproteobacteria bacterium]
MILDTSVPEQDPPRRRLLVVAGAFYAAMTLAAFIWGVVTNHVNLWILPQGSSWLLAGVGALLGVAFGLLIVTLSRQIERFAWAQRLNRFFADVLGPITWREAAILAALSGIGEELFFRGAVQPTLGLWWTTTGFALMHLPPRRDLMSWAILAWILGLALGLGAQLSGNLAGPILAHFVINLLNLRHIGHHASTPPPAAAKGLPPREC